MSSETTEELYESRPRVDNVARNIAEYNSQSSDKPSVRESIERWLRDNVYFSAIYGRLGSSQSTGGRTASGLRLDEIPGWKIALSIVAQVFAVLFFFSLYSPNAPSIRKYWGPLAELADSINSRIQQMQRAQSATSGSSSAAASATAFSTVAKIPVDSAVQRIDDLCLCNPQNSDNLEHAESQLLKLKPYLDSLHRGASFVRSALESELQKASDNASLRFFLAADYDRSHQYARAISEYTQLLSKQPGLWKVQIKRAGSYHSAGQLERASQDCAAALQRSGLSDSASAQTQYYKRFAYELQAEIYLDKNEVALAEISLAKFSALPALRETRPRFFYCRARCHLYRKRWKEALNDFAIASSQSAELPQLPYYRALALYANSEHDSAYAALKEARGFHPADQILDGQSTLESALDQHTEHPSRVH